jgi:hypothetical protein
MDTSLTLNKGKKRDTAPLKEGLACSWESHALSSLTATASKVWTGQGHPYIGKVILE